MNNPTEIPYIIAFEITDLIKVEPTKDTVIITAPNEIQAEALFTQEFDSALYSIKTIEEWEAP